MDRFESKIDRSGDCWLYTGAISSNGYGNFWYGGRSESAHVMSYRFFVGEVPKGMVVRHTCDNKQCVRPSHLVLGTQYENKQDSVARGRTAKGSRNGASKLNELEVAAIKQSKIPPTRLAQYFGVSRQVIWRIQSGRDWKHVKG